MNYLESKTFYKKYILSELEQTKTYHFFAKIIVLLVIISLCWANIVPYCHSNPDIKLDLLERCDPIDGESEKKEKKSEKDGNDKIPIHSNKKKNIATLSGLKNFLLVNVRSLHHPEILTPPPEVLYNQAV